MAPPLRVLSIFSGIGGLDAGIPGARVLGYCEREAFPATVLLDRMETEDLEPAPVWAGDLADLPLDPFRGRVDLVCGGFPCQPWSCAGKREGTGDDRWLWPLIARVVGEIQPRWVFLENVPGLLRGGLGPVLADLAALGFDAEWCCLRASEVGAPHRRERLFVLAHRTELPDTRRGTPIGVQSGRTTEGGIPEEADARAVREGVADAAHDHRRSGERGEETGTRPDRERRRGSAGRGETMGDPARDGAQGLRPRRVEKPSAPSETALPRRGSPGLPEWPPGPGDAEAWARVLAERPDLAPAIESPLRGVAHGIPARLDGDPLADRTDRLRALGNAVVPQQARRAYGILRDRFRGRG